MLFSSIEFIFFFLPIVLGVYFLVPGAWQNFWLALSGYLFYAIGEPKFSVLMVVTVTVDLFFAKCIEKLLLKKRRSLAKGILASAVAVNIGQLVFFKYFDIFGFGLPLGISFYVFQALSYVIDVYWQRVRATESLVDLGAYVALFPQLIAGPIVKYSDIERELKERQCRSEDIADGLRRFCAGLCKKVIIADPSGAMWKTLCADNSFFGSFLAILFFSLQIYFDFSGYSDMAIGLGRVLGFRFPENFNYPYISKSVTEFWRRWHMTLSSWFREYVYIPLGGNRGGRARTYRNLLITWGLTGLWHGAGANFLFWGLYFAVVLIIEKAFLLKALRGLPSVFSHLYALLMIFIGWLVFSSDGGFDTALRALGIGCEAIYSGAALYHFTRSIPFLMIAAIGCTPLPRRSYLKIKERYALIDILLPIGGLLLSLAYIVSSGYAPFLYFRF